MLWRITGTLTHHTNDDQCCSTDVVVSLPSFILDGDFLGIVSAEHAEQIARQIVLPVELAYESVTVHVTAVPH